MGCVSNKTGRRDRKPTSVPVFDRREKAWRWFAIDTLRVDSDGHPTGVLHREDGPAVEDADGTREWWIHGQLHREDGPAFEGVNGSRSWWIRGQRHREDGPAFISADGARVWYVRDQLHREDGPAVVGADGTREWWIRDQRFANEGAWQRALSAKVTTR